MSSTGKIKLRATSKAEDVVEFQVEEDVVLQSETLKHIIEEDLSDEPTTVPNVAAETLARVIKYCKKHVPKNKVDDDDDTANMNGCRRSLAFADDGNMLLSGGGDGKIYHWDLRTRRCLNVGVDEGSLTCTSLCASPDSRLFATGSTSGVVNFYRNEDFMNGKCKPLKTVENLTTTINQVKFNNDAQILAITSSMNRSSLKLVHVPSFTVFSNFPYPNVSLKHPKCLDFSPGGGFMAVGNAAGRVLLYKLHHYQNA